MKGDESTNEPPRSLAIGWLTSYLCFSWWQLCYRVHS